MKKEQKIIIARVIVAAVLMIGLAISERLVDYSAMAGGRYILFGLYMVPYLIAGYDILLEALEGILNHQVFDECFLMVVATMGAIGLALVGGTGDYTEAVAVMVFYQVGELFEDIAVDKSRRNISELMDIRPDYANVEIDGKLTRIDPDEVGIGSTITVLPGEKIPIDGIITEGSGTLDTRALTGESVPRDVASGDSVVSGCISINGVLKIRTTTEFWDSTASKILDMVENASSKKSHSENFISKFARYYTPTVCTAALVLALLPPVVRMLFMGAAPMWGDWIYRALIFLVISCPCALVISIPLSFFAAIGGASHEGILIKGSNYLEALSKTTYLVCDKTGTLTEGVFEVVGVYPAGADAANTAGKAAETSGDYSPEQKELLRMLAHVECFSSHPIAKSLITAYGSDPDQSIVTDVEETGGHGLMAAVGGVRVAAGNAKLMEKLGIQYETPDGVGTVVYAAVDGKYAGAVLISDRIKKNSARAISILKGKGIKTVMLTGDAGAVADAVAAEIGIDEVKSELLPQDKVRIVEEMLAARGDKEVLAFVGDGINDAPVLTRADVGIAMGAMGSDAAIEAADIVLMDDDPMKISKAIRISKKCMRIVYENIYFSIGIKVACMILGALGLANMWMAIFADVGVMVIAVSNSIRVLFTRRL